MQSKSCVYWIRLPEHTDIFSQGYVGVCKHGAEYRFKEHESKARNGSNLPIHRAIRKYANKLIIETVVLADINYCYDLEANLRPASKIGYNIDPGGDRNRLGTQHSDETKAKMSAAAKAAGRKPNQAALDNSAKTNSKMVAWLCRFSNKDVWKMADKVFNYLQENPKHGYRRASTVLGTTPEQLSTMFKKIKTGWNPLLDTEWLIFSGKLSPDASGDKSI